MGNIKIIWDGIRQATENSDILKKIKKNTTKILSEKENDKSETKSMLDESNIL